MLFDAINSTEDSDTENSKLCFSFSEANDHSNIEMCSPDFLSYSFEDPLSFIMHSLASKFQKHIYIIYYIFRQKQYIL